MSTLLYEYIFSNGKVIQVAQGNLVVEETDVIVNAANGDLSHGGGVAMYISQGGGPTIQQESFAYVKEHGRVETGDAVMTSGGNLKAKWVAHAVGPIWGNHDGDEPVLLYNAVQAALREANAKEAKSIALPGISSGIFGGPKDVCALTAIKAAFDYLVDTPGLPPTSIDLVRFVNIDEETATVFAEQAYELIGSWGL